jgi:hypothetical protein
VTGVHFSCGSGNDTVTVNPSATVGYVFSAVAGTTNNLVVNGDPGNDSFVAGAGSVTGSLGGAAFRAVSFSGVTQLTFAGGGGHDQLTVTPYASTAVSFTNSTTGTDTLTVTGPAGGDAFTVTPSQVALAGYQPISYGSNVGDLYLHGGSGNNTFDVTPSTTATLHVDGGPSANNTLRVNLAGTSNAQRSSTAWTFANRKSIFFTNIETFTTYGR